MLRVEISVLEKAFTWWNNKLIFFCVVIAKKYQRLMHDSVLLTIFIYPIPTTCTVMVCGMHIQNENYSVATNKCCYQGRIKGYWGPGIVRPAPQGCNF